MCDFYVGVAQRRYNFDVRLVRFRPRAYEFQSEVVECSVTCNCGAFILMYVMLNVCANVQMGAVIVGYGITMYTRGQSARQYNLQRGDFLKPLEGR